MERRDRIAHRRGVLVFAEDAEHHHRLHVEERHDDLAAPAPFEGVHLRDAPDGVGVGPEEADEVLEQPSLQAVAVHLVLLGLLLALVQELLPEAQFEIRKDMNGKDRMLFVYFNCPEAMERG